MGKVSDYMNNGNIDIAKLEELIEVKESVDRIRSAFCLKVTNTHESWGSSSITETYLTKEAFKYEVVFKLKEELAAEQDKLQMAYNLINAFNNLPWYKRIFKTI